MTWFKVDDKLHSHKKALRAGHEAMGLWVLAGSWSGDQLTDGWVPEYVATRLAPNAEALADRLVRAGLWETDEHDGDTGWRFRGWAEMQPSREEVEQKRAEARARMRRNREQRRRANSAAGSDDVRANDQRTNGEVPPQFDAGSPYPDPTRPDPTRSSPNGELQPPPDGGGDARATREGAAAIRSDRDRARRRASSVTELAKTARSGRAHHLVEVYAAGCQLRPGPRLITQLGVEVDVLLTRGWPEDVLAECIEVWGSKGLGPSMFQSVANEVANRRPARASPDRRPSTTDQRVAAGLELVARYEAEEAAAAQVIDMNSHTSGVAR